ncbi:hypothetical protein HNY73_019091 [Argiope bruennichi]|uniref:Uncharacterized protein n=1 Tax=Argiope bruennichi TaxID=94029 RepID=A0A8T0EFL9_ARGBR|nr:hypothetical protein HNY73_019091 [Argiope bruennichi]
MRSKSAIISSRRERKGSQDACHHQPASSSWCWLTVLRHGPSDGSHPTLVAQCHVFSIFLGSDLLTPPSTPSSTRLFRPTSGRHSETVLQKQTTCGGCDFEA